MPELPEVETIVRDLAPQLEGRKFHNPRLLKSDVLRKVSRERLLDSLRGRRILSVRRRAKHVVFLLDGGLRLVIQPRMTGVFTICRQRLTQQERRYAVLLVSIGDGATFVYRDVRRLGTIWLLNERQWQTYTAGIGPEPLDDGFDLDQFVAQIGGSRQAIKKVLMDQRRLAGVGNIYANEALFRARVDPSRATQRLSRSEAGRIHREVRAVLSAAIAASGTTVRDYRTGTGQSGSFQFQLRAYGRGGEPCPRCRTRLVTTHAIDGRATTFCWRCQRGRQ
ncbi:MAG: bifunctional DNA-formamidopyrimidine glycosylase/DNA-(apurinic or apyrimidinic site) lyase [Gemmatimonadota bacterium]|nr:MAG: bifunctional DNA-formamidopyrimidine glycosylase/DNA-(apurinic or apyrimidinic site) lyase [Gemmatimonadota bacterium]